MYHPKGTQVTRVLLVANNSSTQKKSAYPTTLRYASFLKKSMLMKRKFNLQQKIILIVVGVTAIIYAVAIGYISASARKAAVNDAVSVTLATAQKHASDIKALLEKDLATTRTLASTIMSYSLMPEQQWKEVFPEIYRETMEANPHLLSVWDSWELKHIDTSYTKDYGRFKIELWRDGGEIKSRTYLASLTGDSPSYAKIKNNPYERIENPYFSNFTGNEKDNMLMTSLVVPLTKAGDFIGVVGLDIALESLYNMVLQVRPFKGSYAFLLSNDLKFVAHPNADKLGANAMEDYETLFTNYTIDKNIANGKEVVIQAKDENGVSSFFVFTPITIGKTSSPWSLAVVVPKSTILASANKNFFISLAVGILGLLILGTVIIYFSRSITNPIRDITAMLKRLAKGNVSEDMKLTASTNDEIGQMTEALNTTIESLNHKVDFATHIGKGNLNASFTTLTHEDALGKALLDMRDNLKKAEEENAKRQIEDEQRRWANEGLAKFGEILRQNNDNLEVLSKSIISELVNTLNANQGGLFLLNEDDPKDIHFELAAAYAYNRIKHKQKKVLPGEGLIGACAIEKKSVLLTEIPNGYIEITSGLGESNPSSLAIIPLLIDEKVLGVIEIASFNEFVPHQIEFLEKVAQSIASTITSVKVNIRTSELLTKTQQQAEEMLAQEEEMRQNMEELQATQEESTRRTNEMQSFLEALNLSSLVVEYDSQGYITSINDAYLELLNLSRDQVVGTHHTDRMEFSPEKKIEYDSFWDNLRKGLAQKQVNKFIVEGKTFTLQETYTPIKDDKGEVYKVLKIANNITNLVQK